MLLKIAVVLQRTANDLVHGKVHSFERTRKVCKFLYFSRSLINAFQIAD